MLHQEFFRKQIKILHQSLFMQIKIKNKNLLNYDAINKILLKNKILAQN